MAALFDWLLFSGLWTAGVAALALAWRPETAVRLLCGSVFLIGLFHRRLKRFRHGKVAYLSVAWTSVVVGLPALAGQPHLSSRLPRVTAVSFAAAAAGTTLGLLGPSPALSAVPCAEALVLLGYRAGERYVQGVLDGALLVGGAIACGLAWLGA